MTSMKYDMLVKLFGSMIFAVMIISGCGEKDVLIVIDENELERYINETEEGRELFRTEGLFPSAPYQSPGGSITIADTILDFKRTVTSFSSENFSDYGTLGMLREGVVFINDKFTIQTTRQLNVTITVDTTIRNVNRNALFLKLGDDSRPFLGWKMWGYNGVSQSTLPVSVRLQPDSGLIFFGDLTSNTISAKSFAGGDKFIPMSNIRALFDGESLICSTSTANTVSPLRTFQLLSFAEGSGFSSSAMNRIDRQTYLDTIQTPVNNPRLWNIIFFQAFNDSTLEFRSAWCAPYRIPQ